MADRLPNGAAQLSGFAAVLRRSDFAVAPEQNITFLEAVTLLGPGRINDVRLAARAAFGPPPERLEEFEALFRAYFYGEVAVSPATAMDQEPPRAFDGNDQPFEAPDLGELNPSGQETSTSEVLSQRTFDIDDDALALRRFRRQAGERLPRRLGHRRRSQRQGDQLDVRRILKNAIRNDGDVSKVRWRRRTTRQRNVLILIDVSGSMKEQTDGYMRFAHAATHAADRVECFTFGTRLTRVTRSLRLKNQELALARAAETVADWDGGTRIGESLQAFLVVPRFAGYARGALVIVLSDGLERGDPSALIDAVGKLSRRAWRIVWLSPLASDPHYAPQTTALAKILPLVDVFDAAAVPAQLYSNALAHASAKRFERRSAR
ncbi:MAG: VWA domain-containing protein [Pseudomonadota bacterium]